MTIDKYSHVTAHRKRYRYLLSVVGLLVAVYWWGASSIVAQAQLINPTAPPPGGQTAVPLNTSSQAQQKLGSLIIGNSHTATVTDASTCDFSNPADPDLTQKCAELCLNGNGSTNCLKSWSGLGTIIGNSFVELRSDFPLAAIDRFNSEKYDSPQTGYVKIQGVNPVNKYNTVMLGVYSGLGASGPYTALYADGMQAGNYAGSFVGKFGVEPTAGPLITPGRLCLNGTGAHDDNTAEALAGHYCISQWSDINGLAMEDKLTLQPSGATLATETGNVGLTQGFGAGAIVLGYPNNLLPELTCGDGMCGTNESAAICPIDCAEIKPASTIVLARAGASIAGTVTIPAQNFTGNVNILVVRSDSPAINSFAPIDGVTHTVGVNSGYAVVYAGTAPSGGHTVSFTDIGWGLVDGQIYTYSVYLANLYPRYSLPKTATIKTDFSSMLLTLAVDPMVAGSLVAVDNSGDGETLSCSTTDGYCTISYPRGTNVVVSIDVFLRTYKFLYLQVTEGGVRKVIYSKSYSFIMNNNTTVSAKFMAM